MQNKFLNITRGEASCDHCSRPIKILCHVLVDGSELTVGSTCIEKFIPELANVAAVKLNTFNAMERKAKKQAMYDLLNEQRREEFEIKIDPHANGENLVKLTIPEMVHDLSNYLVTSYGFETTDDETILQAPDADALADVLDSFEGVAQAKADPELMNAVEWLRSYDGNFEFLRSCKSFLNTRGYLSDGQLGGVMKCYARNKDLPAPILLDDATITVTKGFAKHSLRPQTGLDLIHYNFKVFKILRETARAYQLEVRATAKPTSACCVCGIRLTNPASIRNGIGPVCAEKYGVPHWQNLETELEGVAHTFTAWIPKKSIKDWTNFPMDPEFNQKEVDNVQEEDENSTKEAL